MTNNVHALSSPFCQCYLWEGIPGRLGETPVRELIQLRTWGVKCAWAQEYRSTGVKVYRCTGIEVFRYTVVQLYRCTAVSLCSCIPVLVCKCIVEEVYQFSGVKIDRCTYAQV